MATLSCLCGQVWNSDEHGWDCPSCAANKKETAKEIDEHNKHAARKATPLFSGCIAYFPDALLEIARLSKACNDQHNPGEPMHWAREKSSDHLDALARHLVDAGTMDDDGQRHTAKVAWRALAQLQLEMEEAKGDEEL